MNTCCVVIQEVNLSIVVQKREEKKRKTLCNVEVFCLFVSLILFCFSISRNHSLVTNMQNCNVIMGIALGHAAIPIVNNFGMSLSKTIVYNPIISCYCMFRSWELELKQCT